MSKLPVPTAKDINDQHALARSTAETAVQHAIKCGAMLARKKDQLGRGDFDEWVKTYCDFGRSSAYAYMKVAAKSPAALGDFRSIQEALGYEKPKEISRTSSRPLDDSAAPIPKSDGNYADSMPQPVSPPPAAGVLSAAPSPEGAEPAAGGGEPEWTAADEAQYQAEEQANAQARKRSSRSVTCCTP